MPKIGIDYPETITIRITEEQKKFLMACENYSEIIRVMIASVMTENL